MMKQTGSKRYSIDIESNTEKIKEKLPTRVELHGHKYMKKKRWTGPKTNWIRRVRVSIPLVLLCLLLLLPITILSFIKQSDRSGVIPVSSSPGEKISFATEEEPIPEEPGNAEEKEEEDDKQKLAESNEKEKNIQASKDAQEVNSTPVKVESQAANEQKEKTTQNSERKTSEESIDGDAVYHTVQPGETLFRIAMNYYQSQHGVEKIKQANGLSGNEISVGQKLKIPK